MPESQTQPSYRSPIVLWSAGIATAALGAWVMFDAEPGINWVIWTLTAVVGLLVFVRSGFSGSPVTGLTLLAVVIAGGASITADPFLAALICLSVILLLAVSMLLSVDPRAERIRAGYTILAPAIAFVLAIAESLRRATEALQLVRSPRARAVVRGVAITIPIVLIFALLLSTADPVFALWREAIDHLIANWDFIPRTIFFIGLLAISLGAFGYAERGVVVAPPSITAPITSSIENSGRWLGSTERLIMLGGIALLFWIFLLVQLSYFFGNLPGVAGSGMTFAEYARRGFGELSVVASCSALLIIVSERYGEIDSRKGLTRAITLAVIVAVFFLLGSAFHRVSLYEEAYGYTTARLYAQAYMIVVAVCLVALIREVLTTLEPPRLFLRAWMTATLAFVVLIYWNHEAWIANRNIDLYATTGKLDTVYLTRDLSADAIPTIVRRLPTLSEPAKSLLTQAVKLRYARPHADQWFEWNLGRVRARQSLLSL